MFQLTGISPLIWVLLALGLIFGILFIIFGPNRYNQLTRTIRCQAAKAPEYEAEEEEIQEEEQKQEQELEPEDSGHADVPRISVIAFSTGRTDEVGRFLEAIAAQDYPNIEVVVVVDGSAREASNLSETYGEAYPNVGFTFVPPEAHNLSRRKLGNTIGIKKATGDIILTTLTNIEVTSDQWLSLMASQFGDAATEIVLGAAYMDLRPLRGPKQWYRRFDTLLTTARWMLSAIDGKPYRGDGANLAFRRETFFRNSGYGNNYFLHSGDDDIFVNQVATAANSRFMFAPQATVLVNWGESTRRMWINMKERYTFSARYLDNNRRVSQSLLWADLWLYNLLLVAAGVLTGITGNLLIPIIAFVLLFAFQLMQIMLYRRLATCFRSTRLWFAVPLFYLLKPLGDILFRLRYARNARFNFTYRR